MITIKDLSFRYHKIDVLKQISLNFERGKIYGLLGENGVGKTTLLKVISGLQPPYSGTCEVDGMESFARHPQMLQNICFLPDAQIPTTGKTPLQHIRWLAPFYPNYNESRFHELMKRLNVDADTKFRSMSLGMQKKSMIAVSLALGTDYLLLDEPTNGLDIPSKSELRRILAESIDENKTILISTHQVKDVENLLDTIIILTEREVLLNCDTDVICRKLCFQYSDCQEPQALYSEPHPGGYINVTRNIEQAESQLNIEALFNAVIRNRETIKEIFNDKWVQ